MAQMWLNIRGQNGKMSCQRTAYHLTEAKRFAEWTPGVGEKRHMLLLSNGKPHINITSVEPMKPLFEKFGPKDTKELDSQEARDSFMASYSRAVMLAALAGPPFKPPKCPIATAWGFLWTLGCSGSPMAASTTARALFMGSDLVLERFGMPL
jgi:hypothetical protein